MHFQLARKKLLKFLYNIKTAYDRDKNNNMRRQKKKIVKKILSYFQTEEYKNEPVFELLIKNLPNMSQN